MTYPTTVQLRSWGHDLDAENWERAITRVERAIELDRSGTSIPDGYPTSTMGGMGGTNELTSVEAAVHARQTAKDEHHEYTKRAVTCLADIMLTLARLHHQLDVIEGRAVHPAGREAGCSHHHAMRIWAQRFRGDLCSECYRFKLEHGCLPPFKLLEDRARGIRWTTQSVAQALRQSV